MSRSIVCFVLWFMGALFGAAVVCAPGAALAHPGHHHGQAAAHEESAAYKLASASHETYHDHSAKTAGSTFGKIVAVFQVEAKTPCDSSTEHSSCNGTCCCTGMGCCIACIPSEGPTVRLFPRGAEHLVSPSALLSGITPSSLLEPPNASA